VGLKAIVAAQQALNGLFLGVEMGDYGLSVIFCGGSKHINFKEIAHLLQK
jgi:hypothetical protein